MRNQRGSAGLVVLFIAFIGGAVASGLIDNAKLEQGKVRIDKQVVADRQPVDYKKLNK